MFCGKIAPLEEIIKNYTELIDDFEVIIKRQREKLKKMKVQYRFDLLKVWGLIILGLLIIFLIADITATYLDVRFEYISSAAKGYIMLPAPIVIMYLLVKISPRVLSDSEGYTKEEIEGLKNSIKTGESWIVEAKKGEMVSILMIKNHMLG